MRGQLRLSCLYLLTRRPPKTNFRPVRQSRPSSKRRVVIDSHPRPPRERQRSSLKRPEASKPPTAIAPTGPVTVKPSLSVRELSQALGVTISVLLRQLLKLGITRTANDSLSSEEIELLAVALEREITVTTSSPVAVVAEDSDSSLTPRAPVVAVLGHVDHGKTTLLDALRRTSVAAAEEGGITQHLGAYQVDVNGRQVTFLDTPGHEAFSALRARGAEVADLVVLVVAADDGVRPQTLESLAAAREADVPVVVAVNKVDLPQADTARVYSELASHGLQPEQWGGDVQMVEISAKAETGLSDLVERILLVADAELDLRANADASASGVVIESRLDPKRGPLATLLVKRGQLRVGDIVAAGTASGRVRTLSGATALPGAAVEIVGLDRPPEPGSPFQVVGRERVARELAAAAQAQQTQPQPRRALGFTVGPEPVELKLLVKADTHGSLEAVEQSLAKLTHPELQLTLLASGVGPVGEADVARAGAAGAEIVCFQVALRDEARRAARGQVRVHSYRLIHELVAGVERELVTLLPAVDVEDELGVAEVIQTFRSSRVGLIAGTKVLQGVIRRDARARLRRAGVLLVDTAIDSLQREQQAVAEVSAGHDCGLHLAAYDRVEVGDTLEVYARREAKRQSLTEPSPVGQKLA
jgi:translation initiation factor IF-2